MLNADKPIKKAEEDSLGRRTFAESLGKTILNYNNPDSLVLGLYGSWGYGKTSIINMTIEYMKNNCNENTIVFNFNPWIYSDQKQLIAQFFNQLSLILGEADDAEKAKEIGEKLQVYAKFFTPLSYIPTIGPFARAIKDIFEGVGSSAKSWGELKKDNLEKRKLELEDLLKDLGLKIVVIIDDIDRLNKEEIRQIFQLVKSIGDLPNMIYLLSFDKNVVTEVLKEVQNCSGEDYLGKIVQVPFEIPLIEKEKVESYLFEKLEAVIQDFSERWDKNYWSNIYHNGLKLFFKNIRDVNRFINVFSFNYMLIKDEANKVDIIVISAVQVFNPRLYKDIANNKELFTNSHQGWTDTNEALKEKHKKLYDKILEQEEDKDQIKTLLTTIFPQLNSIFGNYLYGASNYREWRIDRRICSPDFFDLYFRLALNDDEVSKSEIDSIIEMSNNYEMFYSALSDMIRKDTLLKFLKRFEDYTTKIPFENIKNIVSVLMDMGDNLPEEPENFFGDTTNMRVLRIIYQLLKRIDSEEERYNILYEAIENTKQSLYTLVHEIAINDQEHGKYNYKEKSKADEDLLLSSVHLKALNDLGLGKIREWANSGRLMTCKGFQAIIYRWRDWGGIEEVKEYIQNNIDTDKGLLNIILKFVSTSYSISSGEYEQKEHKHIFLNNLKEFIDIEAIEPRIRNIYNSSDFDNLLDEMKEAVRLFLDTYDGKIKNDFE